MKELVCDLPCSECHGEGFEVLTLLMLEVKVWKVKEVSCGGGEERMSG